METRVDEIAERIDRLSTFAPAVDPVSAPYFRGYRLSGYARSSHRRRGGAMPISLPGARASGPRRRHPGLTMPPARLAQAGPGGE